MTYWEKRPDERGHGMGYVALWDGHRKVAGMMLEADANAILTDHALAALAEEMRAKWPDSGDMADFANWALDFRDRYAAIAQGSGRSAEG